MLFLIFIESHKRKESEPDRVLFDRFWNNGLPSFKKLIADNMKLLILKQLLYPDKYNCKCKIYLKKTVDDQPTFFNWAHVYPFSWSVTRGS